MRHFAWKAGFRTRAVVTERLSSPPSVPMLIALAGLVSVLQLAVFSAPSTAVAGEPPHVLFDVNHAVACRDVTPPEYDALHPATRLVECRFQISTFIHSGDPNELVELLVTIESPRKAFEVVDYEPKTTLESPVAGNVGVERKKEKSATVGLGLAGSFQHVVKADASGSVLDKTLNSVRYDLIPAQELVAASGTIQRGHGVYFKLKPSKSSTLEGAKEFMMVIRVPRDWQADYIHLRCEATAHRRGALYGSEETVVCGLEGFVVALYAAGSEPARSAVEQFVQAERDLRRVAAEGERLIRRRAYPSLAHKLGRFFELSSPRIPDDWYRQVLYGGALPREPRFVRHLPDEVADAARRYLAAKRALHKLGAGDADASSPGGQLARQATEHASTP